jgi:hypothetical protein
MSRQTPSKQIARAALVILWLFSIVAAYFWVHKPLDRRILQGLWRSTSGIAAWLGVTWIGASLGQRVVGGLLDDEHPLTRLALSAGLGLGLLSLAVLGLGLLGLLKPIVMWGLLLALGTLLWPRLRPSLLDAKAVRLPDMTSGFKRWVAVYGCASLLLSFFLALAPPTGWDTLVYHLTGPRLFIEAGRIVHPIDLPYLGFPQLAEMQFTLGLLLVGERVAPLLHFGYGVMALAITISLGRRAFGEDAAWLAAALLLSVPTLLSLMSKAYVDATLLFYATATLYVFLRWRESQAREGTSRAWLLLLGLFCGLCGGVKYTAIAIAGALGVSLVWVSRRRSIGVIAGRLALVAIPAILVALPWTLENWLTTGNPVYPFFLSHGVYWDEWRSWWYDRPGTGLATTAPWRLLTAPLEAIILGTEGTNLYEATIGPLLLPSLPLLLVVWRKLTRKDRGTVGHLLLFFAVGYGLWLNGLARTALLLRTRFLFLTFGAVAVLGGAALDRLRAVQPPQLALDWLVRAVISLTLALSLFSGIGDFLQADPLPVNLGMESRDSYLKRRLGWYYPAIEYVNETLDEDSVVLFLWEPRSYHCTANRRHHRRRCRPDALLDRWLHTIHLYGHDSEAIASAWRADGVTHVLLHQAGLDHILEAEFDPVTPSDVQTLDDLKTKHMSLTESFGSAYELYRLRSH